MTGERRRGEREDRGEKERLEGLEWATAVLLLLLLLLLLVECREKGYSE